MSRKSHLFIMALLTSSSIEEAARTAGIGTSTAGRWYKREDFQAEFKRAQSEIVGHAMLSLKNTMNEAITVLRDIMGNAEAPSTSRVTAARAVLDNAFHAVEITEILGRLEALEKKGDGGK